MFTHKGEKTMKQALIVEASPLGASSSSRKISQELEARLREEHPEARIVRRDLAQDPVPHLDGAALGGFAGKGEGARLSDELIEELLASDLLVIATPMWNFGIPSALKAWVDHVVRAGKTFSYAEG